MNERIQISTLTDGGQQPAAVAAQAAAFIAGATRTLELAQYDFNLGPDTARIVGDAIREAADRGVRIRFAYNVDHPNPMPVPPPSEPDVELIATLPVEGKAIAGIPDLMHHKYVVRDAGTDHAAVLTGSTNWTNDSWNREENAMFTVASGEVAADYAADFAQLWERPVVACRGESHRPGRRWRTARECVLISVRDEA